MEFKRKPLPIKPTPTNGHTVGKDIKTIDPRTLSPERKQKLWAGIKRDQPELAELLTHDQNIKDLKNQFDAFIIFDETEADHYMSDPHET